MKIKAETGVIIPTNKGKSKMISNPAEAGREPVQPFLPHNPQKKSILLLNIRFLTPEL